MKNITNLLTTIDQRYYQIAFLTGLLSYGAFVLHIPHLSVAYIITVFSVAQVTQWVASRIVGITYDFRSPIISSLAICILLSTFHLFIGALAAFLMVASKFVLRVNNKHIFNPANFGFLVPVVLLPSYAAITPEQWGNATIWASLFVMVFGILVTRSIQRYDIAFFFLIAHVVTMGSFAIFGYTTFTDLLPQFSSIALILFTFFMITDPKTIPNSRFGRGIFAVFCASYGGILHFVLDLKPGFVYAIFIACACTPLIDMYLKGERFEWRRRSKK